MGASNEDVKNGLQVQTWVTRCMLRLEMYVCYVCSGLGCMLRLGMYVCYVCSGLGCMYAMYAQAWVTRCMLTPK